MSEEVEKRDMRMAKLWGSVVDDRPVLDEQLVRTDDAELTLRVLGYLRAGHAVLRAPTLLNDEVDPARGAQIPLLYMTDGEWIWSAEHGYYLEHYGVLPEQAFLDHMAALDFAVPAASPESLAAAARLLQGDAAPS